MGLIKEPLEIDFVVESRPLTKDEKKAISEFIKADKEKRSAENKRAIERRPKSIEEVN